MPKFKYTDETPMPWGKYKGDKMEDVPAKYLLWMEIQRWFDPGKNATHHYLKAYIDENRDVLEKEAAEK